MEEQVTIKIYADWVEKNFCATVGENVPGAIVFTAKNIIELKQEALYSIRFHVKGMIEDGDEVPEWLAKGNYVLEYVYMSVAALLHACEPYSTIAALSRATGINQRQLSHYANGIRNPRPQQRQRIVDGIHQIGKELMSVC